MQDQAAPSVLTFLIADVRGYTQFTVEHGDDAAAKLATRFAAVARQVVSARDGKVIELRGDEALSVFSSTRQALWASLGTNPGVAASAVSGLLLWLIGYPDQALERANRAVELATELEHPFSLAYALFHTGFLHLWRREPELVRDRAAQAVEVAEAHDLRIWSAVGACLLGAAKTWLGRSEEGLADIRTGLALYQGLKTPPVFWPLLLSIRAGACGQSGKPVEGLSFIEEAIEVAGTDMTLAPEFFLLKADLLLAQSEANRSDAEAWYLRAFERARELDARMPQLRAAMGLCRSQRVQGNSEHASQLLSSVYSTFTEGFTTPDLIDARVLLENLPQASGAGRGSGS